MSEYRISSVIALSFLISTISFSQEITETFSELKLETTTMRYDKITELGENTRYYVYLSIKSEFERYGYTSVILTNNYQVNQLVSDIDGCTEQLKNVSRNTDVVFLRKWYKLEVRRGEDFIRFTEVDKFTGKEKTPLDYGKITLINARKIADWMNDIEIPTCE